MPHRLRTALIPAALAVVLGLRYLTGIGTAELHPDESQWIASSRVFEDYFSARFTSEQFAESYWTLTQPPLARYVIGLGRRMGGFTWVDLNRPWDFSVDEDSNARRGAVPSDGLLWWSRLPMALLAVVSAMIGFVLVRASAGLGAGGIWVALYAGSAYFLEQLRRAMGESSLLVCIALLLLACYRALLVLQARQSVLSVKGIMWLSALGAMAGAAGAAKLNGLSALLVGVMVGIVSLTTLEKPVFQKLLAACLAAVIVMVASASTFVGLNPYLWPDPLHRTRAMIEHRIDEMDHQQQQRPDLRIDSLSKRVAIIPAHVFQTYSAVSADKAFLVNLLLCVAGLWSLLAASMKAISLGSTAPAPMAILFVGLATATPPLLTPLDWDRYYLLPVFFTTLLMAVGAAEIGRKAYRTLRFVM